VQSIELALQGGRALLDAGHRPREDDHPDPGPVTVRWAWRCVGRTGPDTTRRRCRRRRALDGLMGTGDLLREEVGGARTPA
jgi:hypothetical protein